jgi:aspartate racemase
MYKKIGIIGGLSPESTVTYYLHITRKYVEQFGDYSYPDIIIYSVNLENYHIWRGENRWDKIADDIISVSEKLKGAGADFCIIATNTMHKVFDDVVKKVNMPFIHILTPTIAEIQKAGINKVGLLGTKSTMVESFYKDKLLENGISTIVPTAKQQEIIHKIIVEELVRGEIKNDSKQIYLDVISNLKESGAEGIILGCTEIPLLISQSDCSIAVFDTAVLHANAALEYAISTDNEYHKTF